jgi:hypothetical protein
MLDLQGERVQRHRKDVRKERRQDILLLHEQVPEELQHGPFGKEDEMG